MKSSDVIELIIKLGFELGSDDIYRIVYNDIIYSIKISERTFRFLDMTNRTSILNIQYPIILPKNFDISLRFKHQYNLIMEVFKYKYRTLKIDNFL